jgi:hypothetical protein
MKISELNTLIENIVSQEVKKTILKESEGGHKEVYHIKCEGVPLGTFESEEDAKEALPHYKAKHKHGELIIEKGVYESHDDMMNKLDEMNDQLEETDNMENTQMDEKLVGNQGKLDKNHNGVIDGQDFKIMRGQHDEEEETYEGNEFSGQLAKAKEHGDDSFEVDGKEYPVESNEEEECNECGNGYMEEDSADGDDQYHHLPADQQPVHEGQMCNECGGMLNEEGTCNECGVTMMRESKKKKIRMTESELVSLIKKMVSEATPGISMYEKNHKLSGSINKKEMDAMIADINKNHIDIEGSDKPEFPHPIGKGEKVARENTKAQDEETAKNFAGLQNLDYDLEPSEAFKKRLKMSIIGDTLMGNAPTTEPAKIKPSNGGEKGKDSEKKEGNVIPTPETGKKIEKQAKDRKKDKDERVLYSKERVPVKESNNVSFENIINEEVEKMKKLFTYNKKTQ